MNTAQAIAAICDRLGNRIDLQAQALTEMQIVQNTLELKITPWFLASEVATVSTVAGEERIAVPTDYLGAVEESPLWYLKANSAPVPLVKSDYRTMRTTKITPGEPEAYARVGSYFRIGPVPDAIYSIMLIYYAKAPVLDGVTVTTNAWLTNVAELMIAETCVRLAKYTQDNSLLQIFMLEAQEQFDLLWRRNEEMKHENMDYTMEFIYK